MLSNGVTANRDSVAPAPKPAMTVRGPDTLPSGSASSDLYVSNATNPATPRRKLTEVSVVFAEWKMPLV